MGSIPSLLAAQLRDAFGLRRAVETGTYLGTGARTLAGIFDEVVTIELSPELAAQAQRSLDDCVNVSVIQGDSRVVLAKVVNDEIPSLYWIDGHWSGGLTAGQESECPILEEISAIRQGPSDSCVLIDDARLFVAAPPPPHDPAHWPTLVEVIDALRSREERRHTTVIGDLIVDVPAAGKPLVDSFGRAHYSHEEHGVKSRRRLGLTRVLPKRLSKR
jgi:hypothetical protein